MWGQEEVALRDLVDLFLCQKPLNVHEGFEVLMPPYSILPNVDIDGAVGSFFL